MTKENRSCEECTLCCLLLPIITAKSNHSELCSFCKNDKCSIYNNRPKACNEFNCMWVTDNELSSSLRPDKCNVIFEKVTDEIFLALNHFNNPKAWQQQYIIDYMKKLNDNGISVIISSYSSEPKNIMLAENHTDEYVWKTALEKFEN